MIRIFSVILLASCSILAALPEGISFTPYGMAQYRLRYEFVSVVKDNESRSSGSYLNMIGYKAGLKASFDKVMFQFEIGNDWGSTEIVNAENYNYLKRRDSYYPYFSLAFFHWDPGFMHIQGGIVPVKGTSVTDLLAASLYNKGINYKGAPQTPWSVITNGSMQGLRIGAPLSKNDFKIGFDFFTTVISQRAADLKEDFVTNADGVLFMLELPIAYKSLTILPQFIAIPYRKYDKINKEKDHEFMGGIEGGIKVNDAFSLRFGYGFAAFNQNVLSDTSSSESVQTKQIGMNGGIGSTISIGPGKLDVDLRIGYDEDLKTEKDREVFPFLDSKYTWALNKHFSIAPRLRIFVTTTEKEITTVKTRPELMFTGSF